jgi:hypothetical protein
VDQRGKIIDAVDMFVAVDNKNPAALAAPRPGSASTRLEPPPSIRFSKMALEQ